MNVQRDELLSPVFKSNTIQFIFMDNVFKDNVFILQCQTSHNFVKLWVMQRQLTTPFQQFNANVKEDTIHKPLYTNYTDNEALIAGRDSNSQLKR